MMAPVTLNVYDLTTQNDWTYWCGVGVFHTGVEVYGIEYAYGMLTSSTSSFAADAEDVPVILNVGPGARLVLASKLNQ
jgi:hypothetical protein